VLETVLSHLKTHTYKAIVFVAVAVEVCLSNPPKPKKRQNNEQPNEYKANHSLAEGGSECRK